MTLRVFLLSLMVAVFLPKVSFANECSALFSSPVVTAAKKSVSFDGQYKQIILNSALAESRIQLTKDQGYINEVLSGWDIRNSSPHKVEKIAQALVMKSDSKKSFLMWLRGLVQKGDHVKEVLRVKTETDILTIDLLDALEIRGYHKENSKYEAYKAYRKKHYNKIQLAKFAVINAAIMGAISSLTNSVFLIPLYFPHLDFAKSTELSRLEIHMVRTKGFEAAYPTILNNHKLAIKGQATIENAPQYLFSAALTYVAYNYFTFKAEQKIEEVRYTISENQKIPVHEKFFMDWKKDFEKQEGRTLDMKTAQDRHEWDLFVQSIYRAWADMYHAKNGRYPELTKAEDLRQWEQFLKEIE